MQVEVKHSQPSIPDPSAIVVRGPSNNGLLYRWKTGDTLSLIAVAYHRPSTDWKVLYELNSGLFFTRHNLILEGDLIKIPPEWLNKEAFSYDRTKVQEGNQDYRRESYIKEFYGSISRFKDNADGD